MAQPPAISAPRIVPDHWHPVNILALAQPCPRVEPQPLGLSKSHIVTAPKLSWSPYGRYVQISVPQPPRAFTPPHVRKAVSQFSPQSRKRMLQKFAQIDEKIWKAKAVFVTLTYGASYPTDPQEWTGHFRAFMARFERQYPGVSTIWRLEFQDRGAPHYHLLIVGLSYVPWRWVVKAWREIALPDDINGGMRSTKVERIRSFDKAVGYLQKYMAKVETHSGGGKVGRMWGIRRADRLPVTILQCEVDPITAGNVRAGLIRTMHLDPVPHWLKVGHGGAWTMIDPDWCKTLLNAWAVAPLDWDYVKLTG